MLYVLGCYLFDKKTKLIKTIERNFICSFYINKVVYISGDREEESSNTIQNTFSKRNTN